MQLVRFILLVANHRSIAQYRNREFSLDIRTISPPAYKFVSDVGARSVLQQ
jgi:hypothetical protein